MNSGSEQKLSLEQLKQRNTQEPPAPPKVHPTREEWSELLAILSAQYRLTAVQYDLTEELLKKLRTAPTAAQTEEILRELRTLRKAVQQGGKPKEKSFSLPRLPRLRLPQHSAAVEADAVHDEVRMDVLPVDVGGDEHLALRPCPHRELLCDLVRQLAGD